MYSDREEQRRQLILYWISTDPLASWRRLITCLDTMGQSPAADGIRDFAEPLAPGSVLSDSVAVYVHVQGDALGPRHNNNGNVPETYYYNTCVCVKIDRANVLRKYILYLNILFLLPYHAFLHPISFDSSPSTLPRCQLQSPEYFPGHLTCVLR